MYSNAIFLAGILDECRIGWIITNEGREPQAAQRFRPDHFPRHFKSGSVILMSFMQHSQPFPGPTQMHTDTHTHTQTQYIYIYLYIYIDIYIYLYIYIHVHVYRRCMHTGSSCQPFPVPNTLIYKIDTHWLEVLKVMCVCLVYTTLV